MKNISDNMSAEEQEENSCCQDKCNTKFNINAQRNINREFLNLHSCIDKKHFVLSTIQRSQSENDTCKDNIEYFLPLNDENVKVCQKMYLDTLSIDLNFVEKTLSNITSDGRIVDEDADDSEVKMDSLYQQALRAPCINCSLECSSKISQEVQTKIHHDFWQRKNYAEKANFIFNTVSNLSSQPNCTRKYLLPVNDMFVQVCRTTYFNTLGINEQFLHTIVGQIMTGANAIATQKINLDYNHVFENFSENTMQKKIFPIHYKRRCREKKIKPTCDNCRLRCGDRVPEEYRKKIVKDFWVKNDVEKKDFVMRSVTKFPVQNRTGMGSSRRSCTKRYSLPVEGENLVVCQKMYFNTVRVNPKFVDDYALESTSMGSPDM